MTLVSPASAQPASELKPYVERIARSDGDDAAEATDELIRRIVGPLAEALRDLDARPPDQQRRLLAALGRVTAQLRLRLYRATLPSVDQKLFDQFAARHRELVERLFDDDPRRRLAGLQQIPLELNTGAGVLIVAKVYDWDAEVVDAALGVAASLKDEVVARGLTRYVGEATTVVRSGQLGPDQQDVALVLADNSRKAIRALGQMNAKDCAPVVLEALACFARPAYRQLFAPAEALEALGRIGDERAVPALLEFLNDHDVQAVRSMGPGKLVEQTVGDAALLALARTYRLPPEKLGFSSDPSTPEVIGFTDEEARAAALRAFARWHKQNADKPADARAALTTQPAP